MQLGSSGQKPFVVQERQSLPQVSIPTNKFLLQAWQRVLEKLFFKKNVSKIFCSLSVMGPDPQFGKH